MAKMYIGLMLLLLVIIGCSNDQGVKAPFETGVVEDRADTETVNSKNTDAQLLAAIQDLRTGYEED